MNKILTSIKEINSSSSLSDIKILYNKIKNENLYENLSQDTYDEDVLINLFIKVKILEDEKNLLLNRIGELQEYIDNDLTSFIKELNNEINDYATAYSALINYDEQWFLDLYFSDKAKASIAYTLINLCNIYIHKINPIWELIADENYNSSYIVNINRISNVLTTDTEVDTLEKNNNE